MDRRIHKQVNDILLERRERLIPYRSWAEEKELLKEIAEGRADRTLTGKDYRDLNLPKTLLCSRDMLNHQRYSLIIAIALFSRAAIEGGVPDDIAFAMSDGYMRMVETLPTPESCFLLYEDIYGDFVDAVSRYQSRRMNLSPAIKKAVRYITEHLHETVRVNNLAQLTGLSESHLSARFKKETGHTIPDYIRTEKVIAAESLLISSALSITEIGLYLGFCNQSYFSKVFHDITGQTPLQYRDQKKRRNRENAGT